MKREERIAGSIDLLDRAPPRDVEAVHELATRSRRGLLRRPFATALACVAVFVPIAMTAKKHDTTLIGATVAIMLAILVSVFALAAISARRTIERVVRGGAVFHGRFVETKAGGAYAPTEAIVEFDRAARTELASFGLPAGAASKIDRSAALRVVVEGTSAVLFATRRDGEPLALPGRLRPKARGS